MQARRGNPRPYALSFCQSAPDNYLPRLIGTWGVMLGRAPPDVDQSGVGAANEDRFRILVVEDDWLISTQIKNYLSAAGLEIIGIAIDANEALHLAQKYSPHLILMDIRLAGDTDGVELAKQLWGCFGLRSLFVSGNVDPSAVERAVDAKPAGWLPKPFTEAELLHAVWNSLNLGEHSG